MNRHLFIFLLVSILTFNIAFSQTSQKESEEYAMVTSFFQHNIKIQYSNGVIEDYDHISKVKLRASNLGDSTGTAAILSVFKYLNGKGYEFVSSHAIDSGGNGYYVQYIFRRKK